MGANRTFDLVPRLASLIYRTSLGVLRGAKKFHVSLPQQQLMP